MPSPSETLRTLLLPTDLQSDSRDLLTVAAGVARPVDAEVALLHVVEAAPPEGLSGEVRDAFVREREAEARRTVELQADDLASRGVRVAWAKSVHGRPAHEMILEAVHTSGADLIVMRSHARPGKGHRIGSTADRLLRTSPVPVLVLRGETSLPVRKVAVLTDFSERSGKAARRLIDWLPALTEGDAPVVQLVHVGDLQTKLYDPIVAELLEEKLATATAELRGALEGRAEVTSLLVWGDHPVDEVLEAAPDEGWDLLIAGTHGHGPIRRALIGSVAMGLSQSADIPVLIVTP